MTEAPGEGKKKGKEFGFFLLVSEREKGRARLGKRCGSLSKKTKTKKLDPNQFSFPSFSVFESEVRALRFVFLFLPLTLPRSSSLSSASSPRRAAPRAP